jgi:hypothetical protein
MSEPLPIAVRYNQAWGIVGLLCSVFILGVAFLTGDLFPQAITGGILLFVSFGFLTQTVFVVAPGEVQLRNLLGMTMKRHPFSSLADLELRDGRLRVDGKPVGAGKFMLRGSDWEALGRAIEDARADVGRAGADMPSRTR